MSLSTRFYFRVVRSARTLVRRIDDNIALYYNAADVPSARRRTTTYAARMRYGTNSTALLLLYLYDVRTSEGYCDARAGKAVVYIRALRQCTG